MILPIVFDIFNRKVPLARICENEIYFRYPRTTNVGKYPSGYFKARPLESPFGYYATLVLN